MAELTFPDLQRQMQLGKQSKQGVNFTFRNAEQIYNKFKELDSGWILTVTDELFAISDRLFVKATATARKGDETHQATAYAELDKVPVFKTGNKQMQDPQWTGAVSSYARKYAVQGLFAIGEKDVDEYPVEDNQQQQPQQQQSAPQGNQQQGQPQYISQEQYNEIELGINQLAALKQTITDPIFNFYLEKFKVSDFHALTIDQHQTLINHINSQIAKAQAKQQ